MRDTDLGPLLGAIVLLCLAAFATAAHADYSDDDRSRHGWSHHGVTGLVKEVIEGTRRFRDVTEAEAQGWMSARSCVSGREAGAMGIHYVNNGLVGEGLLDPRRPEALIYEPRHGKRRLVGVEFIVIADVWHASNVEPPVLLGQHFHYTGAPNRYGLPAFYALHVWAWKRNPNGMFVDWNPRVSCEAYAP